MSGKHRSESESESESESDPEFRPPTDPNVRPDQRAGADSEAEAQQPPRRSRQPTLTAMALLGVLLLVLAVAIFGGIF